MKIIASPLHCACKFIVWIVWLNFNLWDHWFVNRWYSGSVASHMTWLQLLEMRTLFFSFEDIYIYDFVNNFFFVSVINCNIWICNSQMISLKQILKGTWLEKYRNLGFVKLIRPNSHSINLSNNIWLDSWFTLLYSPVFKISLLQCIPPSAFFSVLCTYFICIILWIH